ncbi:MAG TPA: prolyl oligopeptidase family serine peptidase [Fimbriimonas sp.]|nr:prolyl oligopeptidase family serine peptidase [Fimbriimonas sp.]
MAPLALLLALHGPIQGPAQIPSDAVIIQKPVVKTIRYLIYFPDGYAGSHDRFPFILFLHGSGERGTDLNDVRKHGPPKETAAGRKLPFVIISPQCDPGASWDTDVLTALLNDAERRYRIDKKREYLTGLSMGGFGTWALAIANPKRFAAIAPIAAGGDPTKVALLKNVPVWVTHGDKDPSVPIARDQEMVDALKAAGGDVRFDIVPGGQHDVWTPVYAGNDLYSWFLSHKLP